MATRKTVKDSVTLFMTMTPHKKTWEEMETLEDVYYQTLKRFPDKDVKAAVQIYMAEGEFFPPRPIELIKRMDDKESKHNAELRAAWTCSRCKQKVSSISPLVLSSVPVGVCLDCQGVPSVEYEHIQPLAEYDQTPYKIEGRVRCTRCGNVGQCIKEPADTGEWLCKQCYTGRTNKEIAARFKLLGDIITGKIKANSFDDEDRIPY